MKFNRQDRPLLVLFGGAMIVIPLLAYCAFVSVLTPTTDKEFITKALNGTWPDYLVLTNSVGSGMVIERDYTTRFKFVIPTGYEKTLQDDLIARGFESVPLESGHVNYFADTFSDWGFLEKDITAAYQTTKLRPFQPIIFIQRNGDAISVYMKILHESYLPYMYSRQ
ncbi:MAG: hypothetical protein ABI579_04390 [Candidatus Sumerlaeota bacterium]